MPKLALFAFNHEFIDQSMNYSCTHVYQNILPNLTCNEQFPFMLVCFSQLSPLLALQIGIIISFCQSVNEKESNFTTFASDSDLKTVNSGHFEALVRKVTQYLMSIKKV